jgi:hypothetical protein
MTNITIKGGRMAGRVMKAAENSHCRSLTNRRPDPHQKNKRRQFTGVRLLTNPILSQTGWMKVIKK